MNPDAPTPEALEVARLAEKTALPRQAVGRAWLLYSQRRGPFDYHDPPQAGLLHGVFASLEAANGAAREMEVSPRWSGHNFYVKGRPILGDR